MTAMVEERRPVLSGSEGAFRESFACELGPAGTEIGPLVGRICARLAESGVDAARLDDARLALTEAINNVHEHAYGGKGGPVSVMAEGSGGRIILTLHDQGAGMTGVLPGECLPSCGADLKTLPEGGFGWFMIRQLADSVEYSSKDGLNELRLVFDGPARRADPP